MQAVIPCKPRMRGQWNSENASVISADDAAEPTVAIAAGNAPWWKRSDLATRACRTNTSQTCRARSFRGALICRALTHLRFGAEIVAKGIRFEAAERRSSVRDRLRNDGVDGKLGGVNRFTTMADAIDNLVLNVTREQT